MEDVAARDSRVRVFRQPKNQGKGAALRRAIGEMRGDLTVFQDADPDRVWAMDRLMASADGGSMIQPPRFSFCRSSRRRGTCLRSPTATRAASTTDLRVQPPDYDNFQGLRIGRESIALAASSSLNRSASGSQLNFLPTLIAMLARWQTVETRWPMSAGK